MIVSSTHDGRKPSASLHYELTHNKMGNFKITKPTDESKIRHIKWDCGCTWEASYKQVQDFLDSQP